MAWRNWLTRLTRSDRDQTIQREIRIHLELEAEDQQDLGLSPDEAQAAAARAFGNRALVAEDTRAVWRQRWIDALVQDLRYALRTMRRAPGFSAMAIGSSALGIGGCTAIFAVVTAGIFTTPDVVDPGRLMRLSELDRRTGEAGSELSYPDFLDLRQARSFDGIAASDPLLAASLGGPGEPERHWGSIATANYFDVVRPRFALGRGFDARRDDGRGESPVIVLSHALWMRRFGGDPQIVGHAVQINSRTATVIGVTAAGFRGTEPGIVPEFWIPFSMMNEVEARRGPVTQNRQRYWLTLVARLRPDVEPQAARAELATIERQLTAEHGRNDRGFHLEPVGKIDPRLRRFAVTGFSLALAITVLVLLTACTNVANLLLGRAAARRREIAARMALGAGRRRLVRQFLTESLLLAGLGGVGGWIVARYASSLLGLVRTPFGWPLDLSFAPDARMVLFSLGLSLVTGLAFGLMPALKSTRADIVAELKADPNAPKRNRSRLRHGLVVVQVAVSTVLLVCMGLFLRSLQSARGMDVGMTTGNLALLAFDPSLNLRPDAQSRQLLRDILTKAQGVSGVESATMTSAVPLTLIISNSNFVLAERAKDPAVQRVRSDIYAVGPRFFATLGIPFLAGEDVHDDPPGHARPAIPAVVNEAFARAAFAGGSPIGARILGDGKALDIVGVVATVKSRSIAESPRPAIYLPILSEYSARDTPLGTTLIVKTRTDPSATMTPLREAIRTVDPSLAVFDVRTMEDQVRSALILPRLTWAVSAIAGCIGLVLAIGGVYGVISFAVARRRREIGIRLAIGARPVEVLMMILKQGAALALAGIVLGAAAALLVTRFSASLLYGVSPTDRVTFIAVPILLLAVSIVACLLPARAAARLDPVDVLRAD